MSDEFTQTIVQRFTPPADNVTPDWEDVLRRARIDASASLERSAALNGKAGWVAGALLPTQRRQRFRSRRSLAAGLTVVFAVATLALVTPVGPAIARAVGDFTSWLSGNPGEPASPSEQGAFTRATRSWTGFPSGTELRRLVQTRAVGATFTLYGFRGAGSLCLRLDVSGAESARRLACPPLSELKARAQPALVVAVDYGVGSSGRPPTSGPFPFRPPSASVTFGVVADGVERVSLRYSDGSTARAVLNGNAFLAVNPKPGANERLTGVWAETPDGRVAIPFAAAPTPFGRLAAPARPLRAHGPARVQRVVKGGAIRWLARREPRGDDVPSTVHGIAGVLPNVIFNRQIAPDPAAPERLVVSVLPAGDRYFQGRLRNRLQVCAELVGGRYRGGGCWPAGRLFSTAPFSWTVTGSDQYVTIAGLASDEVARLVLYLGTGKRVAVPLHDNGYFVEAARADYPLRLVAYDSDGLVIGITTLKGDVARPTGPQPAPNATWRTVLRNEAGQVVVARSTSGGSCYAIRHRSGAGTLGCPPPLAPDELEVGFVGGESGFTLTGRAGSAITRVIVHFRDGNEQTIAPKNGYLLALLPRARNATRPAETIGSITGLNAAGDEIAEQPYTDTPRLTGGSGAIRSITPSSISIGRGTTCRRTASSPPLAGYRSGLLVQYLCEDNVLTLIGRSAGGTRWAGRTVWAKGTITALTSSSITIHNDSGRAARVTCSLTAGSPTTSGYKRNQRVQIFCSHGHLTGINRSPRVRNP